MKLLACVTIGLCLSAVICDTKILNFMTKGLFGEFSGIQDLVRSVIKVTKEDLTGKSVEDSSADLSRFFYTGFDWTLNLLPTFILIKLAFIGGKLISKSMDTKIIRSKTLAGVFFADAFATPLNDLKSSFGLPNLLGGINLGSSYQAPSAGSPSSTYGAPTAGVVPTPGAVPTYGAPGAGTGGGSLPSYGAPGAGTGGGSLPSYGAPTQDTSPDIER